MADIDINAGLAIKADVNKLYGDVAGTLAKFKEDRRHNKEAYDELLEKYAGLIREIERIRNQLNDLIETAQSKKLPSKEEMQMVAVFAGMFGAKNQDGTLNLQKLMALGEEFGGK